jgi:hypothetical protein
LSRYTVKFVQDLSAQIVGKLGIWGRNYCGVETPWEPTSVYMNEPCAVCGTELVGERGIHASHRHGSHGSFVNSHSYYCSLKCYYLHHPEGSTSECPRCLTCLGDRFSLNIECIHGIIGQHEMCKHSKVGQHD